MPVSRLAGVGDKLQQKLQRLGIHNVQDLLFLLPYRYIDRTHLTPIGALQPGDMALTQGIIELTQIKYGKRRSLLCRISDGTGALVLRFFYFSRQQQAKLVKDAYLRCWGTPRRVGGTLEMVHPEYQHISVDELDLVEQTLTPVYPATEGLTQARLRRLTEQAIRSLESGPEHSLELLPDEILGNYTLPDLISALRYVHRPPPDADTAALMAGRHPAQQRLAFEELLAHHLSLQSFRRQVQSHTSAPMVVVPERKQAFIQHLHFELTRAQQRVLQEIEADLSQQVPMRWTSKTIGSVRKKSICSSTARRSRSATVPLTPAQSGWDSG